MVPEGISNTTLGQISRSSAKTLQKRSTKRSQELNHNTSLKPSTIDRKIHIVQAVQRLKLIRNGILSNRGHGTCAFRSKQPLGPWITCATSPQPSTLPCWVNLKRSQKTLPCWINPKDSRQRQDAPSMFSYPPASKLPCWIHAILENAAMQLNICC